MTRVHWRMQIELTEEPPAPQWPEGIVLREFVPGQDERAVFDCIEEAFKDHWGHVPRRFEDWIERTSGPISIRRSGSWRWTRTIRRRMAGVSICRQQPDRGGSARWRCGVRGGSMGWDVR